MNLYSKLDEIYSQNTLLYETLGKQISRNKLLNKENSFLRLTLENVQNNPPSLELELLSSEETEELLKEILQKANKSKSLQRSLMATDEFISLCKKVEISSNYPLKIQDRYILETGNKRYKRNQGLDNPAIFRTAGH
jgi:hypothetical protein